MTQPSANDTAPALRHMTEAELVRFALADDYEILEELGRGGMAIVFRAHEKTLDREVAIKVLPSRLVIDKGFVERFEHEARTAAKLEHPNIVPIYRVGRAGPNGDVIYFVMKLLRGQSLSTVLNERGKLEAADVRRILVETAAALNYAARRNVVHRDIKPDNIMLDSEGRCVITDFGIAKAPGGQQTTAGTSLGTPRYMSPEHAMGLQLDGRSDMYSLGVVAYQCLTGRPPFQADEPFAVLYKHIHDALPQPTLANDEERQLYDVIAKMLAKNPDDRFQTGNELIAALGGQVSDPSLTGFATSPALMAPTEVMPTPRPWSISRWRMLSRTRQVVWSTVGVAVVATALGLALAPTINDTPTGNGTTGANAPRTAGVGGGAPTTGSAAATAVPAPPSPSPRAAAILAYNKLKSSCPTRDTVESARPIPYSAILDPVADHPRADRMAIGYDVCGLNANARYTATFTLTKLNQSRFSIRKQDPHAETDSGTVSSPRSKERFSMYTREMSPGDYRLDLVIKDRGQRTAQTSREFRITEK